MTVKKLVMSAFGPFSGQEEIDFTPFSDSVFLIGGDTGAGKTTIFDAICFALYGRPSGSLRKEGTLRNQDAGKRASSFAELTFTAADGKEYTVHRDTTELKKPGSPAPSVSADSVRLTDADGRVLVKGSKKVTEMVTSLTGFDRESFLRVSVLPQGEFDKFLTADSKTRRDTLRRIFGTQLYESYAQVTQKWLKATDEQMSAVNMAYDLLLEKYFPSQGEPRFISGADEYIPKLEEMLADTSHAKQEAEEKCAQISAELLRNNTLKSEAEKANAAVLDWQKALSDKEKLDSRQEEYSGKERLLARQRLAAEAAPALSRKEELDGKITAAQKRLTEAEKQAQLSSEALRTAQEEKSRADTLTPEREEAVGALPGLENLLKKCEEAEEAAEECRRIMKLIEKIHTDITANSAKQEHCRQEKEQLSRDISAAEISAAKIPGLRSEVSELSEKIKRAAALGDELDRLKQLVRSTEKARRDCEKAELSQTEAERSSKELRRRYHAGEAARLARELEAGVPCPVCGSLEHPFPAAWTEDIPTAEELDCADALAEKARASKAAADRAYSEQNGRLEALCNAVRREYQSVMGADMPEQDTDSAVSERLAELNEQCGGRSSALESCLAAEESLSGLRDSLENNDRRRLALEQEQSELTAELSRLNSEYSALKAAAEEKRSGLEGRTPEMVSGEISVKKSRILAIEEQQKQAEIQLSSASRAAAAAETSAAEMKSALGQLESELSAAEQTLAAELERCGFTSAEELKSFITSKQEINALEQDIRANRQALTEAQTRLSECEKRLPEVREIQPPEQYRDNERRLSDELKKEQELLARQSTEASGLESTISEIRARAESSRSIAEKQRVLKELNRVINGSGEERISFEAFIQMRMFRGVLEEANQRLGKMSGGRYRFELRTQNVRANAAEGLDIDIIDYNSGSEARRDVSTLSGGERFMASFALATGLSDYTLRQGAGRRSDMLFIDEGFSSLDSDTFSLAFEVIEKLRAQNRMVGIVTHVGEIQEYFRDRRIFVSKGKGGSTISAVCRE